MTDNLTIEDRKKAMRAVKSKRTSPERRIFAMLAGLGISGWRQNAHNIAGKPDVVFEKERISIFVDGCFWHGCPYCNRKLPDTNKEYWQRKINRNKELAVQYNQKLEQEGWSVIRIWEHEIRTVAARQRIHSRIRQAIAQRFND